VLAEAVNADRDHPPFDRSTRDGFAVRAADVAAGSLKVVGQIRAGELWQGGALGRNEAVEIMTGAPIPADADAVVMVEHVERHGDEIRLMAVRSIRSGENIVPQGSEAKAGQAVMAPGTVIEGAEIALAAACGYTALRVFCGYWR
jgi:molybdopterin molybdotransferase